MQGHPRVPSLGTATLGCQNHGHRDIDAQAVQLRATCPPAALEVTRGRRRSDARRKTALMARTEEHRGAEHPSPLGSAERLRTSPLAPLRAAAQEAGVRQEGPPRKRSRRGTGEGSSAARKPGSPSSRLSSSCLGWPHGPTGRTRPTWSGGSPSRARHGDDARGASRCRRARGRRVVSTPVEASVGERAEAALENEPGAQGDLMRRSSLISLGLTRSRGRARGPGRGAQRVCRGTPGDARVRLANP